MLLEDNRCVCKYSLTFNHTVFISTPWKDCKKINIFLVFYGADLAVTLFYIQVAKGEAAAFFLCNRAVWLY